MSLTRVRKYLLFAAVALCWVPVSAYAEVSCTSSINNKLIGIEFVADSCPTSSNETMHFIETAIKCTDGKVALYAHYGDDTTTPGFLVYYWGTVSGYRMFGNTLGNHIIAVSSNFGSSAADTIDGKQMSAYAPGSFTANVFDKILYPQAVNNDADNDHYLNCDDCNDADPLINPGAAEICNDGKDNDCDGAADCADQDCTDDQACQSSQPDISPTDHPRGCRLNIPTSTD